MRKRATDDVFFFFFVRANDGFDVDGIRVSENHRRGVTVFDDDAKISRFGPNVDGSIASSRGRNLETNRFAIDVRSFDALQDEVSTVVRIGDVIDVESRADHDRKSTDSNVVSHESIVHAKRTNDLDGVRFTFRSCDVG